MTSAKVLPKLAAASLCICAATMLGAGAAMADDPGSMSEAQAMGDPAASAPAVDAPNVFIYQGEEISEKTASELELACVQSIEQYNCRDSEDEFGSHSMARASKGKSKKGASASAACGVVELWLYQHKQYGGSANGVYQFHTWFNLGAAYNNETSSYRTGTASAHMSDFADGGGYWYPGATGYCDYHSNILQPYPEWNDRISSRYRL